MADVLTELVAKISTDASGLKSGLSDAESASEKSSQNMAESLKKVGIAMVAAGAAITAAMGLAAKSAMDAVESENLFNASLGKNAKVVRDWSNTLGKALGLNTYELRKNTGTIYVMVQSMGIAGDAAMDMSEGITELAYDMASFYNISPEEAFGKLKSGLVGMSRPLQDLGILVNETTIKAYALKTGMIEQGQEMTEQQKVTARYGAILQATTVAQGDLARTMDSPTNKLRVLSSTFDELKIVIGENLLPIIGSLMTSVGNVLNKVTAWVKENPVLAKTLTITAAALGVVLTVVGGLILILPTLISGVAAFGVVFHAALGPIGLISIAIAGLIAAGIALWRNWDKVSHFFADIWSNMKNAVLHAIDYILKSLQNFVGWIPGLGSKIDEAREKIANMIEAEKIKRDIRDVQRELKELEETATETSETTSELATTFNPELADAVTEVEDRMESLKEEENRLGNQFADLMRKLHFAETEAGQLGLTMNDVYEAMYKLDYETGEINEVFQKYGNITEVDELLLNKLGLTADEVARIVGKLKGEVDKGTESFKKQSEEVKKLSDTVAQSARAMAGIYSPGQSFENLATAQVMAPWQGSSEHQQAMAEMESQTGAFSPIGVLVEHFKRWMARTGYVPSYQSGGYVNETGLAYLHAGEAVIPANESMGAVNINFTQPVFFDREDTMNRFVDMISKTLDRKYRLGGRSLA